MGKGNKWKETLRMKDETIKKSFGERCGIYLEINSRRTTEGTEQ